MACGHAKMPQRLQPQATQPHAPPEIRTTRGSGATSTPEPLLPQATQPCAMPQTLMLPTF